MSGSSTREVAAQPSEADVRGAYLAGLQATAPSPGQLAWRLSRFDHGLEVAAEVVRLRGHIRGAIVADLGAGNGGESCGMLAAGAKPVVVDYIDHGYGPMRQSLRRVGLELDCVLADVTTTLPFGTSSLDGVIALNLVEHVPVRPVFLADLARVLKPGGFVFMTAPLAWKHVLRDQFYGTPLTALLPMRMRCWVAEHVFRRSYPFTLRGRTCYSSAGIVREAAALGLRADAGKYAASSVMSRVRRWPLGRLWAALLARYAFDFIIVRKPL